MPFDDPVCISQFVDVDPGPTPGNEPNITINASVTDSGAGTAVFDIGFESSDTVIYSFGWEIRIDGTIRSGTSFVGSSHADAITEEISVKPGSHIWEIELMNVQDRDTGESYDSTGTTGTVAIAEGQDPPTIDLDYDTANSLRDMYYVHDTRGTGNYATLSNVSGTVHNQTQVQYTDGGTTSSGSKSSNTTYQFGQAHQEVYQEIDVNLTDYDIGGDDTDRWLWFMNRDYGGYNSTDGTGFSNAMGTTVTRGGTPPSGYYRMFHYVYDMDGGGDLIPTTALVPTSGWFKLGVYCRCNDPGYSNGVYKTYVDGSLEDAWSGLQMVTDQQYMTREVGTLGYFIDYGGGELYTDKLRRFDNHKIWVGSDIPSDIRV